MAPGEESSEHGTGMPRPGSDAETHAGGDAARAGPGSTALERPGDQVGPFKLLSLLGEGGFGAVWLAERREPFVQRVALKLIKPGMDSKAVLSRFEQERQALAVMNHPGIAKVLDGGLAPSGRPYFAMEYVKGEPITDFCDRHKLSIEDRLKLFEQACEAIQHAHLKGIVHRDIKPGNILAFKGDDGQPGLKVIDFGVAKAMTHTLTAQTIFTDTGVMVGTLEYMSPEQTDGAAQDIDTRSDIYSLGVLLYELLTGVPPFDPGELRKKAYGEIQRTIREQDPPTPSARLSTMATRDAAVASALEIARRITMPELVRRLRSELEWIPQKAMRKERQHRYQTALEFANDVRAYLDGRPITAAPESTGYRLRKYVRRNRALVAGGAAVFGTLVVGLGLATWQWAEANRARMAAESSEQLAIDEKAAADQARKAAEASESRALAERERRHDLLGVMSAAVALDALRWNDVNAVERELKALDDVGRADRFVARLLRAVRDSSVSVYGGGSGPCGVCLSPDGRRLASVTEDDTILMLDVLSGRPLCEPLRGHEGPISSLTFSPDGRFLASGSYDKTIRVWDGLTGKPVAEPLRGHQDWVTSVAFGPDSRILASGSSDATIRTWDVATGIPVREPLQGHEASVSSVAFCPLGRVLASGSEDETIRLWDASTGEPLDKPFHEAGGGVLEVSFSPDGQTLASTSADDSIRLWDMKTSELRVEPLTGHQDRVVSVTFSPDAQTLASASRDKTIRLWDASTGEPLGEPLRGHQDWITSVSFSLDGRMLVSAGFDDTIRLWDALKCETPGKIGQAISVCFSPDGRTLASTSDDTAIRLWDASTGMPLGEPLRGHERRIQSVSFSPDGRILASGSFDTIRLWDASTGKPWGKPLRSRGGDVSSVAFGPDSRTLAVADGGTLVELWDSWTGTTVGELESGGRGVSGRRGVDRVVFGRDGRTVLGLSEEAVQRWTIGEGQKPTAETRLSGGGGGVPELTHDESKFAQRGSDGSILLKDTWSDSQPPQLLRGHRGSIDSLCFSPDGQTIASAGGDQTVRLWDVPTGKPLGELPREQAGDVSSLCFSPDGQILAICSLDATMFLWHAVPMRERIGAIRARLAQVDTIRAQLKAQIDAVGESTADCAAFQDAVLADPRFAGDLRTAALIVVGEVSQDREAKRAARSQQRDPAATEQSKPADTQPSEPTTTPAVP